MKKEELWELLTELCVSVGVELYDVEVPGISGTGVVRVYIHLGKGSSVQHAHCAALSHSIINHERVEAILPGNTTLEVSSPGINRKLTRSEHFTDAVGERVRVSYRDAEAQKKTAITGLLDSFDGSAICIKPEMKSKDVEKMLTVQLSAVQDARVDFLFE